MTANKNASFTLTNTSLMSSDGMSLSLKGINIADLTVSASAGRPTEKIDATAFSGAAELSATGTVNAILYGDSDGYDTLAAAGSGNDILIGYAGHDSLTDSGSGRNILIGSGAGGDDLTGNGNDILVSGTTSFDSDNSASIAALDAILAEWTSTVSYTLKRSERTIYERGRHQASRKSALRIPARSGRIRMPIPSPIARLGSRTATGSS